MNDIKTWRHSRKGLLTGKIVSDPNKEFVDIEMADSGLLKLMSRESNPYYAPGDIITVRKSFLTEVMP